MNSLIQAFETKTLIGALVVVLAYISKSMQELFVLLAIFKSIGNLNFVVCPGEYVYPFRNCKR